MSTMPGHEPRREPDFEPFIPPKKRTVYMELGDERDETGTLEKSRLIRDKLKPDTVGAILIATWNRIEQNPTTPLSQEEASILYELEVDLPKHAERTDVEPHVEMNVHNLAAYIKEVRGEQDTEQIKGLIIERMRSEKNVVQTATALRGIAENLGLDPVEYAPYVYMQTLKETMRVWEERGIFDFLARELIVNNTRYNIVPVPNGEFTFEQLSELASNLDKTKLYKKADEEIVEFYSHYSPRELSGEPTNGPIRLRLIPDKVDWVTSGSDVKDELKVLHSRQTANPQYNLQVPSVLEAVARWYAMRAGGDTLEERAGLDRTYVRHFDLQPYLIDNELFVPDSSFSTETKMYLKHDSYDLVGELPYLYYDRVESDDRYRVLSVG